MTYLGKESNSYYLPISTTEYTIVAVSDSKKEYTVNAIVNTPNSYDPETTVGVVLAPG